MRSRYTAFVRGDMAYIDRTHAQEMRGTAERSAAKETLNGFEWVRLDVLDTVSGGTGDETGIVEFAAHYKQNGVFGIHRERSNFRRDEGEWVYVDGTHSPASETKPMGKVGRNAPCPCGSGKKFKKCCGAN